MTDIRRGLMLDRLDQLSTDDLAAVVRTVEQAVMIGDGWLQRQKDGSLRTRSTFDVVLHERIPADRA